MSEDNHNGVPSAWTHSIKISDTAKGVRFDVHVWASDGKTAITEAFKTYEACHIEAEARRIAIAPVEVKG